MPSRITHRPARRLEERRAADARSREGAVRLVSHLRGAPRVCPTCGRPDDLFSRLRVGRQNVFGALLRFLDYGIRTGADFDELEAIAEWPLHWLYRSTGRGLPTPPVARGERVTSNGVTLKRVA